MLLLNITALERYIVDHPMMVELDAGLHHEAHHPIPCRLDSVARKGPAMRLDRRVRRLRAS